MYLLFQIIFNTFNGFCYYIRISVVRNESFGGIILKYYNSKLTVSTKAVFPRNLLDDVCTTVTVLQTYLIAYVECLVHSQSY